MSTHDRSTARAARALAPLLACLASSCIAFEEGRDVPVTPQRPTVSSDTSTTRAGHVELEAGVSIDPSDSIDTPVALKWGLDARSELFIGMSPYVWADFGRDEEESIGDVVVGFRQRVQEQTSRRPSLAVQVAAKLPTADEDDGIGTGEPDLFLAGIASWSESEWGATAFAQAGLLGEQDERHDVDGQFVLALAGSHSLDEVRRDVSAFGEIAEVWIPDRDVDQTLLTLGATWAWMPGRVFDVGVAFGLSDDAPDAVLLFGITTGLGALGPRAANR